MTNKELIAEARTIAGRESTLTEGDIGDILACLVNLADALEAAGNAPGQVDEAKLGDLIAATIREVDGDHTMGTGVLGEVVAGEVSQWLRGGGR